MKRGAFDVHPNYEAFLKRMRDKQPSFYTDDLDAAELLEHFDFKRQTNNTSIYSMYFHIILYCNTILCLPVWEWQHGLTTTT